MRTVKKIWGEEKIIINTEYCGKILSLKKGFRCSLHYHKLKDETFYIIGGWVKMEVGRKNWIMKPGDVQRIKPGRLHRFSGLTDAEIIEFSTNHLNSDSYREEVSGEIC